MLLLQDYCSAVPTERGDQLYTVVRLAGHSLLFAVVCPAWMVTALQFPNSVLQLLPLLSLLHRGFQLSQWYPIGDVGLSPTSSMPVGRGAHGISCSRGKTGVTLGSTTSGHSTQGHQVTRALYSSPLSGCLPLSALLNMHAL